METVRYVGMGKTQPKIRVDFSMNQGKYWQHKNLMAGQTFLLPPNFTRFLLDNVPYNPSGNYEIRDGKVISKLGFFMIIINCNA